MSFGPALKVTTFLALIMTSSPVFGFLPGLGVFSLTTKLPKLDNLISSPVFSVSMI